MKHALNSAKHGVLIAVLSSTLSCSMDQVIGLFACFSSLDGLHTRFLTMRRDQDLTLLNKQTGEEDILHGILHKDDMGEEGEVTMEMVKACVHDVQRRRERAEKPVSALMQAQVYVSSISFSPIRTTSPERVATDKYDWKTDMSSSSNSSSMGGTSVDEYEEEL